MAIGCPAICRDEIKEGMVHAIGEFDPSPGDALTLRSLPLFFGVLRLLLEAGVTVVSEAAFQDKVWTPNLQPLTEVAQLRIVHCYADPEIARQRMRGRSTSRQAHPDSEVIDDPRYFDDFVRVGIGAPSMDLDTSSGYEPSIEELLAFVNSRT
jgi:hypothetical protein